MKHIVCLACCLLLAVGMLIPASAAEVSSGDCYCFSQADFAPGESQLAGICIIIGGLLLYFLSPESDTGKK